MTRNRNHRYGGESLARLARLALEAGWTITRTGGGHLKWKSPAGAVVFGPATPSESRGARNLRSQLRHAGLAS